MTASDQSIDHLIEDPRNGEQKLEILGIEVGTYLDWHDYDLCHVGFTDVKLLPEYKSKFKLDNVEPTTCLGINYNTGKFEVYDGLGEVVGNGNIIEALGFKKV